MVVPGDDTNGWLSLVRPKGLLRCAAVHHGEWGQRLRGRGVWETSRTEG